METENYKPSHIWVNDRETATFDVLVVRNADCEAVYFAYGDGAHCTQSAYRLAGTDGKLSHYAPSNYCLHCGEIEPLVQNAASEVTAFLKGKIVYHISDGKADICDRAAMI